MARTAWNTSQSSWISATGHRVHLIDAVGNRGGAAAFPMSGWIVQLL